MKKTILIESSNVVTKAWDWKYVVPVGVVYGVAENTSSKIVRKFSRLVRVHLQRFFLHFQVQLGLGF